MTSWEAGLPDNNHSGGVWESTRYNCPECGVSAFENPFHVWCDECEIHCETKPDS